MEKVHLPAGYDAVLEEFAKKNNVVPETAFYNLMDFIQLKDYSFTTVRLFIESPDSYLEGGEKLEESDILLAYMESYGENTVGAKVRGYYKRDNAFLSLEIDYDSPLSCWEILSMFQRKIPSMEVKDGELYLFYVHNIQDADINPETFPYIEDLSEEEEKYTIGGYFESIYVEEEEDWED